MNRPLPGGRGHRRGGDDDGPAWLALGVGLGLLRALNGYGEPPAARAGVSEVVDDVIPSLASPRSRPAATRIARSRDSVGSGCGDDGVGDGGVAGVVGDALAGAALPGPVAEPLYRDWYWAAGGVGGGEGTGDVGDPGTGLGGDCGEGAVELGEHVARLGGQLGADRLGWRY